MNSNIVCSGVLTAAAAAIGAGATGGAGAGATDVVVRPAAQTPSHPLTEHAQGRLPTEVGVAEDANDDLI